MWPTSPTTNRKLDVFGREALTRLGAKSANSVRAGKKGCKLPEPCGKLTWPGRRVWTGLFSDDPAAFELHACHDLAIIALRLHVPEGAVNPCLPFPSAISSALGPCVKPGYDAFHVCSVRGGHVDVGRGVKRGMLMNMTRQDARIKSTARSHRSPGLAHGYIAEHLPLCLEEESSSKHPHFPSLPESRTASDRNRNIRPQEESQSRSPAGTCGHHQSKYLPSRSLFGHSHGTKQQGWSKKLSSSSAQLPAEGEQSRDLQTPMPMNAKRLSLLLSALSLSTFCSRTWKACPPREQVISNS